MVQSHIQKGEAILVYTDLPFKERALAVHAVLGTHPDVIMYGEEKMKIDTVRDFAYDLQKGSQGGLHGVSKIGVLICDDIAVPAQNALLKALEDIDPEACILIYAHAESVFLSTILSRVITVYEAKKNPSQSHRDSYPLNGKTVKERLDQVKDIVKAYDDEKLTKQDIVKILDIPHVDKEVHTRALSMLKQPSVSVKYVLEYVASAI